MNLPTALRNIHADPFWWRKILLAGALSATIVGAPWAAGLVTESIENVRKGFPTPLPPNTDPWTRSIIGLLSLVIDFFFFLTPLLVLSILTFCAVAFTALGQPGAPTNSLLVSGIFGGVALVYEAAMFGIGVAPVARLIYSDQGSIERALGSEAIRTALAPQRRRSYARARLHSLPAYAPLAVLFLAAWASTRLPFSGSWLITVVLVWLAFSALIYAHLVVAQLYGDAERSIQ